MYLPSAPSSPTEKQAFLPTAMDAIRGGRINRRMITALVCACVVFSLTLLNYERLHLPRPAALKNLPESVSQSGSGPRYNTTFFGDVSGKGYDRIKNKTLGFERIFALSMPGRTDKQDQLVLAGKASKINIEFRDGVDGDEILEKAYPPHWDRSLLKSSLGCFRGHMNMLSEVVQDEISSALFFEDDATWDVHLKEQLSSFAYGSRMFSNVSNATNAVPHSPYGDDWDLIWIGHCGQSPDEHDNRTFVTEQGATVPRRHRRWSLVSHLDDTAYPEQTRIMYPTSGAVCTAAYAVSQRGAQKLLERLQDAYREIDLTLADYCKQGVRCIGVWPPLIGVHRPMGSTIKDSDREDKQGGYRLQGYSDDIVFDVRQNLNKLFTGKTDYVPQWPEDLEPEYEKKKNDEERQKVQEELQHEREQREREKAEWEKEKEQRQKEIEQLEKERIQRERARQREEQARRENEWRKEEQWRESHPDA